MMSVWVPLQQPMFTGAEANTITFTLQKVIFLCNTDFKKHVFKFEYQLLQDLKEYTRFEKLNDNHKLIQKYFPSGHDSFNKLRLYKSSDSVIKLNCAYSPSSSSSLDSSLKGLKSSSSPELTDLKLLSSLSASLSEGWESLPLSSELLPESPPDTRGFFAPFLASWPGTPEGWGSTRSFMTQTSLQKHHPLGTSRAREHTFTDWDMVTYFTQYHKRN